MDKNQEVLLQAMRKFKEIASLFNPEQVTKEVAAKRAQLTFDDFSSTDPSKLHGNVNVILQNTLKDISKNIRTPMLGSLETKPTFEVSSTTFDMHTEALDTAAASNYKVGETSTVYNPTNTYARKTNSIMTMGVGVSVNMLARIVQKAPGVSDIGQHKINRALENLNLAKEQYLFNGDRTTENETDGILTILARENTAGNTATSYSYPATGVNVLKRKDLENVLFSAIFNNMARKEDLLIWACHYAHQTIADWYDDKLVYTTPQLFQFFGDVPVYQSKIGTKFPLVMFNESYISNVSDKVLVLDMGNMNLVRLMDFTTVKDMPITYVMDELNKAMLDSLGLNFLYTLSSGYIENINQA